MLSLRLNPGKHITVLDLRPLLPATLDLLLVHLDHLFVVEVLLLAGVGPLIATLQLGLLDGMLATRPEEELVS